MQEILTNFNFLDMQYRQVLQIQSEGGIIVVGSESGFFCRVGSGGTFVMISVSRCPLHELFVADAHMEKNLKI